MVELRIRVQEDRSLPGEVLLGECARLAAAPREGRLDLGLDLEEAAVRVAQEDQPHDRQEVLVACEGRVGAQVVRAGPEPLLDLADVFQPCLSCSDSQIRRYDGPGGVAWDLATADVHGICSVGSVRHGRPQAPGQRARNCLSASYLQPVSRLDAQGYTAISSPGQPSLLHHGTDHLPSTTPDVEAQSAYTPGRTARSKRLRDLCSGLLHYFAPGRAAEHARMYVRLRGEIPMSGNAPGGRPTHGLPFRTSVIRPLRRHIHSLEWSWVHCVARRLVSSYCTWRKSQRRVGDRPQGCGSAEPHRRAYGGASMTEETVSQHIAITPGVCGGKPRIAGRRITVANIAIWHERLGRSADEITTEYRPDAGRRACSLGLLLRSPCGEGRVDRRKQGADRCLA